MNEADGLKETYLTIDELAAYLKLAKQTVRKYVLHKSIPYRKVLKSVRFRLSEIERWIDEGGGVCPYRETEDREGDLFSGTEAEAGEADSAGDDTGGAA